MTRSVTADGGFHMCKIEYGPSQGRGVSLFVIGWYDCQSQLERNQPQPRFLLHTILFCFCFVFLNQNVLLQFTEKKNKDTKDLSGVVSDSLCDPVCRWVTTDHDSKLRIAAALQHESCWNMSGCLLSQILNKFTRGASASANNSVLICQIQSKFSTRSALGWQNKE